MALAIAILVMLVLDHLAPITSSNTPWFRTAGVGVIVLALSVNIACVLAFKRRGTTILPFHESNALVTSGWFQFSRNPIYASLTVLLLGVAAALGSLSPLAVPPLFVLWINRNVIQVEERMLLERFGQEYRDYCDRVRRWI